MRKTLLIIVTLLVTTTTMFGSEVTEIKKWQFAKDLYKDIPPDRGWTEVTIPHDWAIDGNFDRQNDLQLVAVAQNGEQDASYKTGRSGGLPWIGGGWYKTIITADGIEAPQPKKGDKGLRGKQNTLLFDGAMANAQVYLDGNKVMEWPYGYNSWYFDLTPYLKNGEHELMVRLWNEPQSSRWYPGAGLFRNVHLITSNVIHVPVWGVQATTPYVSDTLALVNVKTTIENAKNKTVTLRTELIYFTDGNPKNMDSRQVVAIADNIFNNLGDELPAEQSLFVSQPKLWSPEHPHRYFIQTYVYHDDKLVDSQLTPFGIRKTEFIPTVGFILNGQLRKFKGVCLHHDFGPLGTAVYKDAIRHQLTMLKDMGCDAIRTTHNMPAPELVELCDEMGFMLVVEAFDVWDLQKGDNDYHKYFAYVETHKTLRNPNVSYTLSPNPKLYTWAERDMINMVRHYRNNPSVMMWSVGNEVWNQTKDDGWVTLRFLQDICHREDPTRPVTCGMDQVLSVLDNRFGATVDIPGLNYRTMRYKEAYNKLPQKLILGSETASTVSSRGVYKFPVVLGPDRLYEDHQSSGYDVEYCAWSGLPDYDFALQDDYPWTIGQFVWTGFDYLGEPSPYDTDAWPSHSSYFGIIDLASLPKDRYWLYRSQWNTSSPTLHALPHWTWTGREGERTPVFVYTSYPEAEVFVNGVSQGRQSFRNRSDCDTARTVTVGTFEVPEWGSKPEPQLLTRYRLMWHDIIYQPGEMKVFAYAHKGDSVAADSIVYKTALKPHHLTLSLANEQELRQQEEGLYYFTVGLEDNDSTAIPTANQLVTFTVSGDAIILGQANGDAACLDKLQETRKAGSKDPRQNGTMSSMHLFAGKCTVIVRAHGPFSLNAATPQIRPATWSNIPDKKRKQQ